MRPTSSRVLTWQKNISVRNFELSSTCTPLQAKNMDHYQACLCYNLVNRGFCYKQCPDNETVQLQFTSQVSPAINNQCASVNLNPNALPQPPVWQTNFATPAKTTTVPPVNIAQVTESTAAPVAVATSTSDSRNSILNNIFIALAPFLYL